MDVDILVSNVFIKPMKELQRKNTRKNSEWKKFTYSTDNNFKMNYKFFKAISKFCYHVENYVNVSAKSMYC